MMTPISSQAPAAPPLPMPRPRPAPRARRRSASPAAVRSESYGPGASEAALRRAVIGAVPGALRARPYDQVTFTFIARLAGVTAADVRRCFATRAEMVLAALRRPSTLPAEGGALAGSGAEVVTRWLEFWECGHNETILRHVYGAATDDRRLAAALEARAIELVVAPFAARVRAPDACPRARLACAQLIGLAMSRYVLRQEPLASADHETIAAWAGPALDCSLNGALGRVQAT